MLIHGSKLNWEGFWTAKQKNEVRVGLGSSRMCLSIHPDYRGQGRRGRSPYGIPSPFSLQSWPSLNFLLISGPPGGLCSPSSSFLLTCLARHSCPMSQTPSYSPVLHIWSQTSASTAGNSPISLAKATLGPSALGYSSWQHLHLPIGTMGYCLCPGGLSSPSSYLVLFSQEQIYFPLTLCSFHPLSLTVWRASPGFLLLLLFSISPTQFWSCLGVHLLSCSSRGSSFAVLPSVCYARQGASFHLQIQLIMVKGLYYFFPCWFAWHRLILVFATYVYLIFFFN